MPHRHSLQQLVLQSRANAHGRNKDVGSSIGRTNVGQRGLDGDTLRREDSDRGLGVGSSEEEGSPRLLFPYQRHDLFDQITYSVDIGSIGEIATEDEGEC